MVCISLNRSYPSILKPLRTLRTSNTDDNTHTHLKVHVMNSYVWQLDDRSFDHEQQVNNYLLQESAVVLRLDDQSREIER